MRFLAPFCSSLSCLDWLALLAVELLPCYQLWPWARGVLSEEIRGSGTLWSALATGWQATGCFAACCLTGCVARWSAIATNPPP